jgi:catechol 2,3-dioxygenase-like lactoylglutathione lyase family enzyme
MVPQYRRERTPRSSPAGAHRDPRMAPRSVRGAHGRAGVEARPPHEASMPARARRARGSAVSGPVLLQWMPARSIYFDDPDGHSLELCAPVNKM